MMVRPRWLSSITILILVYSIAVTSTYTTLVALNEARLDLYVSLYILEYYVLRALFTPLPHRVDRHLRILDVAFFTVFAIIVAYRVIPIIAPGLIGE